MGRQPTAEDRGRGPLTLVAVGPVRAALEAADAGGATGLATGALAPIDLVQPEAAFSRAPAGRVEATFFSATFAVVAADRAVIPHRETPAPADSAERGAR